MKKMLLFFYFFIYIALTIAQTAEPPSGSGTQEDPYLIANLNNLYWITQNEDKWSSSYKQTADIDASSTINWTWTDENSENAKGFKSIGNGSQSFWGNYDGQDHSIDGLYIERNTADNVGMFGNVYDATIKNLHLTNVNIRSYYDGNQANISYDYIGALVGTCSGSTIINCHSSGSVSGGGSVGGLIGYTASSDINSPSIENCSSSCTVTGVSWVGGLIGSNSDAYVNNCNSTGTVTGTSNIQGEDVSNIGGFVGYNGYYSVISECYSTGTVNGGNFVGGFAGTNNTSGISNCYSHGNVSGNNSIGGFIGYNDYDENNNDPIVENCYSTGTVSGNSKVGGFLGQNITSCPQNCFWDTETSGLSNSACGTGKTTAEMQTQSTFTDVGWDFTDIWFMNGYPELQNNHPLPVELVTFSAVKIKNGISLTWETATEINNYGFEIQRKNKNEKWKRVGFVEGHGNSNSPKHYKYIDNSVNAGKYFYRLKQIDINGNYKYSEITEVNFGLPTKFVLNQNYPNPFNPETTIQYTIPNIVMHALSQQTTSQHVQLKVYDILGKEIATLVNKNQKPGIYKVVFDASQLSSGLYFYELKAGNFVQIKKMILLQ